VQFQAKHLVFSPGQEIRVGRVSGSRNQREAKPENGVFTCEVMSREHALLKEIDGKVRKPFRCDALHGRHRLSFKMDAFFFASTNNRRAGVTFGNRRLDYHNRFV
jgi:hypothetical protein